MMTLAEHDVASLSAVLAEWGCKPVHAGRVLRAYYANGGKLPPDGLEWGRELTRRLVEIPQRRSRVIRTHRSADGTVKLLVGFEHGGSAETVLMPGHRLDRAAGCVSSQIGCAMGCDFCASTANGLERNLGVGEIVEQ